MSEVFIKQIPEDLKIYWSNEAKRNSRSMNKELIRVLEEERARREASARPKKNLDAIMAAAREVQSFAVTDNRPMDEILYDSEGMPR
jgi:hypothetical protein